MKLTEEEMSGYHPLVFVWQKKKTLLIDLRYSLGRVGQAHVHLQSDDAMLQSVTCSFLGMEGDLRDFSDFLTSVGMFYP